MVTLRHLRFRTLIMTIHLSSFLVILFVYTGLTQAKEENNTEHNTTMADIQHRVEAEVRLNKVMLYSKSYCVFSKRIKDLLSHYKPRGMEVVELDHETDMDLIQDYLEERNGVRTVPQLFIGGHYFGGFNETKTKDKVGELEKELKRAGALLTKGSGST